MQICTLKIKSQNKTERTNKSKGHFSFFETNKDDKLPVNLIKKRLYTSEAAFKKYAGFKMNKPPDTKEFQKLTRYEGFRLNDCKLENMEEVNNFLNKI